MSGGTRRNKANAVSLIRARRNMKPTHFNVMMSMVYMYKQDILTLDQLHECLEKYEIRPRRKRKSRAKPYIVEIEEEVHTQ